MGRSSLWVEAVEYSVKVEPTFIPWQDELSPVLIFSTELMTFLSSCSGSDEDSEEKQDSEKPVV